MEWFQGLNKTLTKKSIFKILKMTTEFMNSMKQKLMEEKKITETSANQYIRCLVIANCKQPFSSISFLSKKKKIEECLQPYKPNTQKSIITAVVSVLKIYGNEKLYKYYFNKLISYNAPVSHEKTETQKNNWMEWDEVEKIRNELHGKLSTHENRLKHMVLCLYTQIQPRRNLDYLVMDVVPKNKTGLSTDRNYLLLKENKFVFNRYKTTGHYGQQVIDVPEELRKSIDEYLQHHPLKNESQYPLLVNSLGKSFETSGAITRLLNSVFHKKVGASMLRHIYLSHKYNVKEMEKDSEVMAHSMNQQRDYLRE